MGDTEEFRKRQSTGEKVDTYTFQPNPIVETALIRSLESAYHNLHNYQLRKIAYLKNLSDGSR